MSPSMQKACCSVHASTPWAVAPACRSGLQKETRGHQGKPFLAIMVKPPAYPGLIHRFRWRKRDGVRALHEELAKVEGWL